MSKALFVIQGVVAVTSLVVGGMQLATNADSIGRTANRVKKFIKKKIFKQEEEIPTVDIVIDENEEIVEETTADIINDAIEAIVPFINIISGLWIFRNMNRLVCRGFIARESALNAEISQLKQWNLEWQSAHQAYRDAVKDVNIECAINIPKEVTPNV